MTFYDASVTCGGDVFLVVGGTVDWSCGCMFEREDDVVQSGADVVWGEDDVVRSVVHVAWGKEEVVRSVVVCGVAVLVSYSQLPPPQTCVVRRLVVLGVDSDYKMSVDAFRPWTLSFCPCPLVLIGSS